jgi:hypothetical protein
VSNRLISHLSLDQTAISRFQAMMANRGSLRINADNQGDRR